MNAIRNIDSAILYGIYYTPHMLYEYYTILTLIYVYYVYVHYTLLYLCLYYTIYHSMLY